MWERVKVACVGWVVTCAFAVVAVALGSGIVRDAFVVLTLLTSVGALIMTFLGAAELMSSFVEDERRTPPPAGRIDEDEDRNDRRAA